MKNATWQIAELHNLQLARVEGFLVLLHKLSAVNLRSRDLHRDLTLTKRHERLLAMAAIQ